MAKLTITIRQYAKEIGFEIIGKLHRCETPVGKAWCRNDRCYEDDAGNEFIICAKGGILIVTADGAVI